MKKFLRRDARRFFKFGKGKGKKASWRRPRGRDNKMREKRKGYPAVVGIGYGTNRKERGKFKEKEIITVMNLQDLRKIQKHQIGIVGSVGKKKKLEIAKAAMEMKIELKNINPEKYISKNLKGAKNESKK
ncbi:MAG: 50S ribosomal protein L32e [Planctomycetota bacterium]|nr:MAG: 50S ribosomal protein L32e [Planctomycetota bacterium]